MSTPKGMKCMPRELATGDKVFVYHNAKRIVLHMRREVPTSEEHLLEPSFKVSVELTPAEAIVIASDLLNAAMPQSATLNSVAGTEIEQGLPAEELLSDEARTASGL